MPFQPEHSLLRVEVPALHTIDTSSAENLFGMWSLFSKTSHAMEDGKRLENLSWRLWNRETFCCKPQYQTRAARIRKQSSAGATKAVSTSSASALTTTTPAAADMPVPDLSSSLDSASSDEIDDELSSYSSGADEANDEQETYTHAPRARPELRKHWANDDGRAYEKHITPIDLEKIVISIKESQSLEPIEMTLPTLKVAVEEQQDNTQESNNAATPHQSSSHATLLESSASTVATTGSAQSSQSIESQDSSSTEMSTHSIIRGFVPGGAPSSYRSQTRLAQPTPILKSSSQLHSQPLKKKGAMFTIGTSSGEDESSLDSHMRISSMPKSELSESLKRGGILKKTTSFKDEVSTISRSAIARHSPVFESDDEDEEVSESAIEDDDDSSEWEDSDDGNSGPSSIDGALFQRVDSRPNLTSRRSLLTSLMHEPDRAKALANAASRSTPAMRRSRAASPNGPSLAASPESTAGMQMAATPQLAAGTRPQPIIITTSNTHQQLALSPRTTRRNMLSTELTESLRKNLLWERQHKSTGNLAALKRRHTSQDVKNLREHPQPTYPFKAGVANVSFNNDFDNAEIGEYHTRGW